MILLDTTWQYFKALNQWQPTSQFLLSTHFSMFRLSFLANIKLFVFHICN